jgi:starch-binding outer membrane protein SusE/F
MKNIFIYRIFVILAVALLFFGSCNKQKSDTQLPPALSTAQVSDLKSDSAVIVCFVVAEGEGLTERGVCYNTTPGPTTANNKVIYSGPVTGATYNVKLKGLHRLTKYYARAYAIDLSGTIYGQEVSFSTPAALPVLANIATSVLANTTDKGVTATTAINITDDGGPDKTADITKRGVVYGLYPHPTADSTKTEEGTGKGQFTSIAANLKGKKTYYLRAYATNKIGTGYSNEVSFTTPLAFATVKTDAATKVEKTTATLHGVVLYNGGGTISERGFCYGTSANPTLSNTKITVAAGKDSISADVTGLTMVTTYHVRAFVTNEAGTNYGADVSFLTKGILTWNIPGDYVVASYPGSGLADWSPDKSPQVISNIAATDKLEGYVYMANTSNNWKFATQPNWDGTVYGDGGSGKLDASGGNIVSPKGYYKINADATALTYTAVSTVWGIIGDATPGGWGAQTNMEYNPVTWTFSLVSHMTSGGKFKFRGTSDWNVNYGSTAADGKTLDSGGSDIAVSVESDYSLTLDLSHPNAYTYSANRWGVIGDATPGGWGADTNMNWDTVNQVFKVTCNLTVGNFKFRANDDWAINYGGDLNALTPGGADIAIATAGNYTITFDLATLKATVTKN